MKKLLLSLAISSALGLTACGGGGSSSSSSSAGSTVNGTASKGIVSGGRVEAFLFVNGSPDTMSTPIASSTTNAQGKYSLSIPAAHEGKPIFIKISSVAGTTMKCDITNGCDADGDPTTTDDITPFGDNFDLAENELEMSAVLAQASQTVAVNVTPLTTVAAELAKSEINSGASNNSIAISIAKANSQVSTTFGLGADITKIPVVDLTDADDVNANAGTNDSAINYAAINAALVSAKQTDANGAGSPVKIGQAITQFAQEVVSDGGLIANASNDEDTSLEDIFAEAINVIDKVEADVSDSVSEDSLDQQLSDASNEPETTMGELDEPSDTSGLLGNYAKVKAFVEELRELGTAIDSSLVGEGESAQTVEVILDGFDEQIDAADMVSSSDAEATMNALGDAMNAIIDVYDANVAEMGVDSIDAGSYMSPENIPVIVTVVNGVTTLTVDSNITVEVDEQSISVDTDVSAVLTSLVINDNVTESPGEEFNQANAPGTYTQEDNGFTSTLVLNTNGTGTFQDAEQAADAITWAIDEGLLEVSWIENGVTNTDSYSFSYGQSIYDGSFNVEYTIDGQVDDNYTVSLKRSGYDGTETESGSLSGEIDFNISGMMITDSVELELVNGTVQAELSGTIDESSQNSEQSYSDEYDNEGVLTGLLFDVDVVLSQIESQNLQIARVLSEPITDPLTFTGGLELSLSRLGLSEEGNEDSSTNTDDYSTTLDSLGIFGISLAGNVANTSNEAFDFTFDITLDGTGVPSYTENFEQTLDGLTYRDDKVSTSGGETESNYVDANLDLTFSAKLSGISDALDVELNLSRTGYDDASATLGLSYPGRDIEIEAQASGLDTDNSALGDMTITNINDGIVIFVEADVSATNDDDEISVEIRMDTNGDGMVDTDDFLFAEKVTRNGIELLQYVDENDQDNIEFESLF